MAEKLKLPKTTLARRLEKLDIYPDVITTEPNSKRKSIHLYDIDRLNDIRAKLGIKTPKQP